MGWTVNTVLNTALFLFIVGATAWVGPALDEIGEKTFEASQRMARQQAAERRERAAREVCGENAAYKFDEKTLTCFNKKGRRTRQVSL